MRHTEHERSDGMKEAEKENDGHYSWDKTKGEMFLPSILSDVSSLAAGKRRRAVVETHSQTH